MLYCVGLKGGRDMSLKKMLIFLLCLILPCTLTVTALATGDAVPISAAEELELLRQKPEGSFYLTADLDMAGVDWVPVAFRGTLDGGGHTIYNLCVTQVGEDRAESVDGNDKVYDTAYAGFFSTLTGAKVSNLTLQGVDIDITTEEHCFLGGIAGYIKDAEIENCSVLDARLSMTARCELAALGVNRGNVGLGGIAGFGSGYISDCDVDVTLIFDDQSGSGLRTEEFLGGVLSCGNASIQDCSVSIQGYDACRGYVHNGGLVGMYYLYDKSESSRPISRNHVKGQITFYENNPDRRAYCEAYVGEMLSWAGMSENSADFRRNELFDYSLRLGPEQCSEPQRTEEVHAPDCYEVGYTVHTCAVCGNTWRDSFTLQTHTPGDWTVVTPATETESGVRSRLCTICGKSLEEAIIAPHTPGDRGVFQEADYGVPGIYQILCTDCGEVLEEGMIPALVPVSSVTLEPAALALSYYDSARIQATVYPADATDTAVYWSSSDTGVVTVDANGTVNVVGRGTATITCVSADGYAQAACSVRVKMTFWQWVKYYIFFGWARNK